VKAWILNRLQVAIRVVDKRSCQAHPVRITCELVLRIIYDADGNLTYFTDQKGQRICFKYDNLNRATFVGFAANTTCPSATSYQSTITYVWDAGNRIHQLLDSVAGTITRDWDNFDRPIDEMTPQGVVAYSFDTADRVQTITVPGQTAYTYTYDDANRLQSIRQGTTTLVSEAFDDADRLVSKTLPDGIVQAYTYDNASNLTSISYTKGSTTLGSLAYGIDPLGRVGTVSGTWARTNVPTAMTATSRSPAARP
jgi:YD repeat-containing protein